MKLNCEQTREEFSALLDDALDEDARADVEAHLSTCSECLRELGRYKKVSDLYLRLPSVSAPADFEQRLARRLRPSIVRFPVLRRLAPAAIAAGLAVGVVWYAFLAPEPAYKAARTQLASEKALGQQSAPKQTVTATPEAPVPGELSEKHTTLQDTETLTALGYGERPSQQPVAPSPPPGVKDSLSAGGTSNASATSPAPAPEPAKPLAVGAAGQAQYESKAQKDVAIMDSRPATTAPPVSAPIPESAKRATTDAAEQAQEKAKPAAQQPVPAVPAAAAPSAPAEAAPPKSPPTAMAKKEERVKTKGDLPDVMTYGYGHMLPDGKAEERAKRSEEVDLGDTTLDGVKMKSKSGRPDFEGPETKSEPVRSADDKDLKTTPTELRILDTRFLRDGEIWRQETYTNQEATPVKRDSEEFRRLLKKYPLLKAVAGRIPRAVVCKLGDHWYRIEPVRDGQP